MPGTSQRLLLALTRYVRTPEGSRKYGEPIGAPIVPHPRLAKHRHAAAAVARSGSKPTPSSTLAKKLTSPDKPDWQKQQQVKEKAKAAYYAKLRAERDASKRSEPDGKLPSWVHAGPAIEPDTKNGLDGDPNFHQGSVLSDPGVYDVNTSGPYEILTLQPDQELFASQPVVNEWTVKEYQETGGNGGRPLAIADPMGFIHVMDGHHRIVAARRNGKPIKVKVYKPEAFIPGSDGDYYWSDDWKQAVEKYRAKAAAQAALNSIPLIRKSDLSTPDARRSREVTPEQFREIAAKGQQRYAKLMEQASPPKGLDDNFDKIVDESYPEVLQSWGGVTVDAHTGVPLPADATGYALTVRKPGMDTVSIPENPTKDDYTAALREARTRFADILARKDHYLGIFHNDDTHAVEIDPVLVVHSTDEVEQIGAYTRATGGAYNFADGLGYWPPHVADDVQDPAAPKVKPLTGHDALFGQRNLTDAPDSVRHAVNEYIYSSNKLNETLRAGTPLSADQRDLMRNLDAAVAVSRVAQPIQVWRGISDTTQSDDAGLSVDKLTVGTVITDNGYQSTTTAKDQAISFTSGRGSFLLRIVVPPGYGAARVGDLATPSLKTIADTEQELLLARGLSVRITGVSTTTDDFGNTIKVFEATVVDGPKAVASPVKEAA